MVNSLNDFPTSYMSRISNLQLYVFREFTKSNLTLKYIFMEYQNIEYKYLFPFHFFLSLFFTEEKKQRLREGQTLI